MALAISVSSANVPNRTAVSNAYSNAFLNPSARSRSSATAAPMALLIVLARPLCVRNSPSDTSLAISCPLLIGLSPNKRAIFARHALHSRVHEKAPHSRHLIVLPFYLLPASAASPTPPPPLHPGRIQPPQEDQPSFASAPVRE